MSIYQLSAPDLAPLAVGGTTLYLLEGLGFSQDGKSLLVRATFTDDADTVAGTLHYGVWLYGLDTQKYTRCLNTELAGSTAEARLLDINSAGIVGMGSNLVILAETSIRSSSEESRLALIGTDGIDSNLLASVLGPDIQPRIERYSLSQDGRFLALQTDSALLAPVDSPDTNASSDIYLLDLLTQRVDRVSFIGGSEVMLPAYLGNVVTIDGKVQLAFATDAVFSAADKNAASSDPTDAYVWSSTFDATGLTGSPTFSLASAMLQASGGNQASGFVDADSPVVATPAGVFFSSESNDLISSDTNGALDAFLKPSTLITTRVTLSGQGELDTGASFLSASNNGRFAALLTNSSEVSGALGVQQMVVLDRQTGSWHVASQNGSVLANDWVVGGVMAPNGAVVAFTSAADNLSASTPVALGGSLFVATTGFDTNTVPTGSVTISGTIAQGQILTATNTLADVDGLGTVSYQWLADGEAISGATASTFTLGQAQVGKTISVTASYTDSLGTFERVSSAATSTVLSNSTSASAQSRRFNDFNGDGHADLRWVRGNGEVSLWLMNGTSPIGSANFGPHDGWSVVDGSRDFNGDGRSDLLWENVNGAISVWTMDGLSATSIVNHGPFGGWQMVDAEGDYNGDGKADLRWVRDNGEVSLWLMNGTSPMASASFGPFDGGSVLDSSRVFIGVGKTDLLWGNANGAESIWLMDGVTLIGITEQS